MKKECERNFCSFLYPLITCICLVCFTQNISAIVNKMNLNRFSIASTAVSNSSLQKNRSMVQLTVSITQWGFILPRDVVFIQESVEISGVLLHERPVLCAKFICQNCNTFERFRHTNTQSSLSVFLTNRHTGLAHVILFCFQLLLVPTANMRLYLK